MATQAHCAYCFEILSAKLERYEPLNLPQVVELWGKYAADPYAPDPDAPEDSAVEEEEDPDENTVPTATAVDRSPYRPAAVSRLLAPSPGSSSSSSVQSASSTPSGTSDASSATSKSSSRSSFFSLGRSARKAEPETKTPLFVTWNKVSSGGEKRLAGCIGTFQEQPLATGLREYALISALDDSRFDPIAAYDLPALECGVTLLTDFEPVSDPLDWTVGTHGLRIAFTVRDRRYGATYLPDVAREQGWSKEETLFSLMRKAGWSGRRDEWTKVALSVVRYQGRQVRLGYREWKQWREWVESGMKE